VQLWWQQFLLIFLRTNVQNHVAEIQFLIGRRPARSYSSWGTRHHCPVEVGAYALYECELVETVDKTLYTFRDGKVHVVTQASR